jgi:hypothetical protein
MGVHPARTMPMPRARERGRAGPGGGGGVGHRDDGGSVCIWVPSPRRTQPTSQTFVRPTHKVGVLCFGYG